MESIDQELNNYWEPNSFLQNEDFEYDSWPLEEAISGSYDSSSPDGAASSPASKNIVSERNRRQKLNQRLFALRSVVPNITKMDKASIIKDAISYIQGLQYEEGKLEAEIRELESTPKSSLSFSKDFDRDLLVPVTSKKMKQLDSGSSASLIEVLELKVTFMGERTMVVSVTCNKRTDTMVKLCEVFESLNLKILTSNLTSFSGMIFHTVFIELGLVWRRSLAEKLSGGGYGQNGAFESWLKEVFQTGLLTVKKGGKKDTGVIRMVFGGIVDNNKQYGGGGGYMGTCLPNKVQVSKFE